MNVLNVLNSYCILWKSAAELYKLFNWLFKSCFKALFMEFYTVNCIFTANKKIISQIFWTTYSTVAIFEYMNASFIYI